MYTRVLPRDLFNEADLLKCIGKLWIALDEMPANKARFMNEDCKGFDIEQDPNSGAIYADGVWFTIGGVAYQIMRPLNSQRPYSVYVLNIHDQNAEDVSVFFSDGTLTPEFLELIGA